MSGSMVCLDTYRHNARHPDCHLAQVHSLVHWRSLTLEALTVGSRAAVTGLGDGSGDGKHKNMKP